jgi:uridine nucleosidase
MENIIIDCDPGIDDAMAILLALNSPELNVVGLTTVFGNTSVAATTRNALNLLDLAGRTDIPVARGADFPLVAARGMLGEFVHGSDGMGGIGWTKVNNPAQREDARHAAQFIVDTVMARPGEITLVPIGPLTNIALALQLEPRIAQNVKRVVIMGGTVTKPGNVSPTAEANVHNDPHASALVFGAGWDLTMIGLDVTEATLIDGPFFEDLAASGTKFGQFIAQIAPFYQRFHHSAYGYENGATNTHDPSAIMFLIDPTLFRVRRWSVKIPTEGVTAGSVIADRRGVFFNTPKVGCAMMVNSHRLLTEFKARLTRA